MFKKGMIRFRRKMAAVLAAAMLFSSCPLPAYAAGDPEGDSEYTVVEEGQDDGLVSGDEADAVSEDEAVSVSGGEADATSENETEAAEEDVASENETASGSKKDDTFVESEIPTVVTDNFELVSNAQGGSGLEATELYFSDFSSTTMNTNIPARYVLFKPGNEIPADTYFFNGEWESRCLVSSNEVVFNGFTIYDDYPVYLGTDSANKIRVKKNISETINISSASKNEVTAYAQFNDKGTLFEHTGIKFETTDYSEVSIVAKSSNDQKCNVYLKVGDGDVQEKAIPTAGTNVSSIIKFEAIANKTCYLSADPGVCIYYVKVTSGGGNKTWDFSNEEDYHVIKKEIVSLNGLIVDATGGDFVKYDGVRHVEFHTGAKLYVPFYKNSVVRITGANSDQYLLSIKINGGSPVNFAGEFTFECVEGNEKAGYVCIESCWNKNNYCNLIEKIEIMDSHTVSFNALGQNVGTALFGDSLWFDDKAVAIAVEAAVNAAPEGKVFAGWSETENGQAFDLNNEITDNKTFYAIYENASNGELLFSNINNLTSDGKLKYRFAAVNGFTIYDKTDSQNSIRINSKNDESTGVASANNASVSACFTSGCNVNVWEKVDAYITFKTVEDSDIVVVAKNKIASEAVYLTKGDADIEYREKIPSSMKSGVDKASVVVFQAEADSLCKIRVDKDAEVYFIKVMPKSQTTSWNFVTEEPLGVLGTEISGTTAYVDGLYVDTTADGAGISKNSNINDGINLTCGTVIYIPISGNKVLSVDASSTGLIEVNDKNFVNKDIVGSCSKKSGYVKLKVTGNSVDIKKIELIKLAATVTTAPTAQTLSYNGLSQNLVIAGEADTAMEYSLNGTDYSASIPAGKDAGKYTVYYRAKADADHRAGDAATLSVNIAKAELTVTAAPNTITYGDAPAGNGVSYAGFVNNETAEVLGGTLAYDFDYSQYGNTGSYTITPKGLTSGNYDINFESGTLTVNKKTVGLSWSSEALIYNGSAQAPAATATQTVSNDVITVTVTGTRTDAGTGYTATATALTGAKAGNYQLPSAVTTTFSIAKAAAQTIADVTLGKVYTAASVSASVAGKMPADAGTLTYTAGTAAVVGAAAVSSFTVSGSGEVSASVANGEANDVITLPVTIGSTNYADSTVNVVITLQDKAATSVTITGGNSITKTYGDADFTISATAPAAAGNGSFTYLSSSANVASVDANGKVSIKKSGIATITVIFESDTHKGSAEIVLTVNKAKAAVSAAAVSASGLKYNGQAQALLASGAAAVSGIEYSLDGNAYSDTIPSVKDAGSYTVYYRAKADDNHTVGDAEQLTVTIAKADAIVSANNASKSYGASDPQLSAAVTGTFGTDSLSYSVSREEGENVGRYVITPSGDAVQGNYNVTYKTAIFTISKAPINPVVAIADWTQGSEPSTPVISGNPGNGAVTYSYKVKGAADSTYSAAVPSAVGRYTISANIAETANHLSGYATADFNIFKEAAVVTTAPAAYSLIYNGGAQALVSAGAVSGGTIKYAKGSSEAPAESFSEAIPAETNAGTYYVWYKAFGDDNHADSAMGSVMVVISKASQSAPAAPQKQSATTTSITLVPHYGYEYCRSGYAWQSSNTFNGLSADTEYTFYQRVSGDSNYEASPESAGAAFRTEALPTKEDPTPTKEAKPTPSENATPTPSENVTPTPSENITPTPSENVTPTPTGEDVPTPTGEVTPTPSVTVTPTPTAGPLPTFAPTPTPTPVIVEEAVIKFVFADDTNSFSAEYTGNAIKPEIKGYCGSKLLEEGKDYSVSYSKNIAVGKANVNISGKGGYSGRYTLEFSITPKRIDDNGAPAEGIIVSGLTVKGTSKVKPVLAYNGNVLNTKEYSVTSGNFNGTETVTITAKNKNFTGEIKDLPVTRINDKEAFKKTGIKAELANVSHVYDGTPKLLGSELKVTGQDGTTLIEGTDYVVSYPSDVINAGSVKVQIIGIGNYTGSVKLSYKIEPAKNAAVSVKLIPEEGMPAGSYSYSKNGVTPAVFVTATVSGNTYVLAEGIDYTVKYSKNKKAGTAAAVKFSFRGNYQGAKTGDVNFTIEKAGFEDAEIFVGDMLYGKPGNYKAKPVIKVNGEVVANGEYKLSYSISGNNMSQKLKLTNDETEKLITVTATSKGKGFKKDDTISATYRVYRDNKTEVKKAKVTLVEKGGSKKRGNVAYTGNPITFSPDNIYRQADIQVKMGNTVLTGEDVFKNFEVSYADNVAKGKATIILTAKEDSVYSGMCVGTFKIVTRKVK